ncbi:MAG: hypothetical protein D6800_03620, partial [Candidatus Zixiibacteriota bacterium]
DIHTAVQFVQGSLQSRHGLLIIIQLRSDREQLGQVFSHSLFLGSVLLIDQTGNLAFDLIEQ